MLKKLFAAILLLVLAVPALAEETQKPADFSMLGFWDTSYNADGDKSTGPGRIIHSSEVKKGIYVNAEGGWHSNYPQAAQIIKNLLVAKGFKVADKPEDADIGLDVNDLGFDFSEVSTGETTLVSGNHIATAVISGLAVIVSPSNILQAASNLTGMTSRGTKMINAVFVDEPTLTGRKKLDGKNGLLTSTKFTYQSSKNNAQVTTEVFTAYATRLVNNNFIVDTKAEDQAKSVDATTQAEPVQPASAVAPALIATATETAPASAVPSAK
ncbi:MAG: hypothetical protein HKM00_08375 [Gallionella sp.]|nr:hypothetical protein [Gallionella sp.]